MDWGTHVILAAKILEACGLEKGAAPQTPSLRGSLQLRSTLARL